MKELLLMDAIIMMSSQIPCRKGICATSISHSRGNPMKALILIGSPKSRKSSSFSLSDYLRIQ